MLPATAILLLATAAHARLWGWERRFSIVARFKKRDYIPSENTRLDPSRMRAEVDLGAHLDLVALDSCPGFDSHCTGYCQRLQKFDRTGNTWTRRSRTGRPSR